jgi:hypothetical protein
VVTDPATEALILRGAALGRYYERAAVEVHPATEAQILRGAALDRHFGLGRFAVDTAAEAQILRGEAMDRHYALGRFSTTREPGTEAGSERLPVSVTSSGSELDWAQLVGRARHRSASRHRPPLCDAGHEDAGRRALIAAAAGSGRPPGKGGRSTSGTCWGSCAKGRGSRLQTTRESPVSASPPGS